MENKVDLVKLNELIDNFVEENRLSYNMGDDWCIMVKNCDKAEGIEELKKLINIELTNMICSQSGRSGK